ncbi:MAG: hypothetical protein JXR96_23845 [Deltaproteobacteria bacterium]|nr:hypothetical protein [Deltaproteobacteria bacterium]
MLAWMDEIAQSAYGLVALGLAGLLLLGELVVLVAALAARSERGARAAFRISALLAVCAPLAVWLLALIGVLLARICALEAVSSSSAVQKASMLARGFADALGHRMLGGSFALASGLLVLVSGLVSFRRAGRPRAELSLLVGACLAMASVGLGALLRGADLVTGFASVACASAGDKGELFGRVLLEAHSPIPTLAVALGVLALAVGIARSRLVERGCSQLGLAGSLAVLLCGAMLFVATRDHAEDAGERLEGMVEALAGQRILWTELALDLPPVEAGPLGFAPVLEVSRERIVLQGREVARDGLARALEDALAGRLHRGELDLILAADRRLAGGTIAEILGACRRAGLGRIQLATRSLSRVESAVIGALERTRYQGIPVPEGALPAGDESLGDWAERLARPAEKPMPASDGGLRGGSP